MSATDVLLLAGAVALAAYLTFALLRGERL
jgi:hypothetical protein